MVTVDLDDLQGWVVRGYRMARVRHLVLEVTSAKAARRTIGACLDDRDRTTVTTATPWSEKPTRTLNLGFTATGLAALDLPAASLRSFPSDFRNGAVSRAAKIGDTGDSAPEHWTGRLGEPDVVHVLATVHGASTQDVDTVTGELVDSDAGWREVSRFDGAAFDGGRIHFGYRDGISQPRFEGVHGEDLPDDQPITPAGGLLLGHPSQFENLRFTVPSPDALGHNGTYDAFRVLAQDVVAFEAFLRDAATQTGLDPELVAAKLLGRWRNGNSLVTDPDTPGPPRDDSSINDFGYDQDPVGVRCPIGAHMRRGNPRDGHVVQKGMAHTRRIVRRGMPYGPPLAPGEPDDGIERGLLGNFIAASLSAQFEALMYDWINLGLHHVAITGQHDPILGANDPAHSRFEIPMADGSCHVLHGFPRFIRTRGSAYTFVPSLTGLATIASG